jgi:hypothetical protein
MRHSYSAPYMPSEAELAAARIPLATTVAKLSNPYTKEQYEDLKRELEEKTALNEWPDAQVATAVSDLERVVDNFESAVRESANQAQTHVAALDQQNSHHVRLVAELSGGLQGLVEAFQAMQTVSENRLKQLRSLTLSALQSEKDKVGVLNEESRALQGILQAKIYSASKSEEKLYQNFTKAFDELDEAVGKLECSNHPTTSEQLKYVKHFVLHGGVEAGCGAMPYLVSKFSGLIKCSSASQPESVEANRLEFLKSPAWPKIKAFGEFTGAFYKHEPYGDVQGLIRLLPVAKALIRLSVDQIQNGEVKDDDPALKNALQSLDSTKYIFAEHRAGLTEPDPEKARVDAVERVLQCRACFSTPIALGASEAKFHLYQYALAIGPETGMKVSELICAVDNAFQKIQTSCELLGDAAESDGAAPSSGYV